MFSHRARRRVLHSRPMVKDRTAEVCADRVISASTRSLQGSGMDAHNDNDDGEGGGGGGGGAG